MEEIEIKKLTEGDEILERYSFLDEEKIKTLEKTMKKETAIAEKKISPLREQLAILEKEIGEIRAENKKIEDERQRLIKSVKSSEAEISDIKKKKEQISEAFEKKSVSYLKNRIREERTCGKDPTSLENDAHLKDLYTKKEEEISLLNLEEERLKEKIKGENSKISMKLLFVKDEKKLVETSSTLKADINNIIDEYEEQCDLHLKSWLEIWGLRDEDDYDDQYESVYSSSNFGSGTTFISSSGLASGYTDSFQKKQEEQWEWERRQAEEDRLERRREEDRMRRERDQEEKRRREEKRWEQIEARKEREREIKEEGRRYRENARKCNSCKNASRCSIKFREASYTCPSYSPR